MFFQVAFPLFVPFRLCCIYIQSSVFVPLWLIRLFVGAQYFSLHIIELVKKDIVLRIMIKGADSRRIDQSPAVDDAIPRIESGHPIDEQKNIFLY